MTETETLADLIRLALKAEGTDKGRALGEVAKKRGLALTHTQINHILAGTYKSKPTRQTVEAIATLARVSPHRVFKAAGLPQPGPPFAQELPPNVDRLEPHQRKAVIEVVRAFLTDEKELTARRKVRPDLIRPDFIDVEYDPTHEHTDPIAKLHLMEEEAKRRKPKSGK